MKLLFALLLLVSFTDALAHEHVSGLNAEFDQCCGDRDCDEVTIIAEVHGGWFIQVTNRLGIVNEVVPFEQAKTSPNHAFWRCHYPSNNIRSCFFAPPPTY